MGALPPPSDASKFTERSLKGEAAAFDMLNPRLTQLCQSAVAPSDGMRLS